MSWPLNNITTEDAFPADHTNKCLEGGPGSRVVIDIYNAAIYYQLKCDPKGAVGQARWMPEVFAAPGSRSIVRRGIFGVRCRSAAKGVPAQVTMEIVGKHE